MSEFFLRISDPLGRPGGSQRAEFWIDATRTDLRWSHQITGGFAGLEVGMQAASRVPVVGTLPKPLDVPYRGHVEISRGSRVVWQGRVRKRRRGPGGLVSGFTCEGYLAALNGNWSRSTSTTATTSGAALATLAATWTPAVRIGSSAQFIDPNVSHAGGLSEWQRMTVGQVADQIAKEGDAEGNPVDVMVWEGPTLWCLPRIPPDTPDYRVPFDPDVVSWEEDAGGMVSHLTVEYGTGASGTLTAEAENAGFLDTYGFSASLLLPAGDLSADAAVALRNRELARRSVPAVQATIVLDSTRQEFMTDASGMPRPWWLIRPGEWVEVAGEPMQVIVGVTVDATAASAQIELNDYDQRLVHNHNLTIRDTVARLRAKIDPYGGRVR